jgi:excisionase family DNA binding protein
MRILPNTEESDLAKISSQKLCDILTFGEIPRTFTITFTEDEQHNITIPTKALEIFVEVLSQLGKGNFVNTTPIRAELSIMKCADILNISSSICIRLLDSGEIPFSRTGNRRKVAFTDIVKFREKQNR